jgi:hypothetical protein
VYWLGQAGTNGFGDIVVPRAGVEQHGHMLTERYPSHNPKGSNMSTLTTSHTNLGGELAPRQRPISSRSRRIRRTIKALMIAIALPATFAISQPAAQSAAAARSAVQPSVRLSHGTTSLMAAGGSSTRTQCHDGEDNDADGYVDYPEDPECTSALDDDEAHCGHRGCAGSFVYVTTISLDPTGGPAR